MASACAINTATSSPDALLWPSPRLSFSRDFSDQPESDLLPDPSTSPKPASDFEFHLHEPASIIPADELFSNGKLVPLQPSSSAQPQSDQESPLSDPDQDPPPTDGSSSDPLAPSPRAPMCASRWKDLLRLKRAKGVPLPSKKTGSTQNPNSRPLRFLLKKNPNPKASSEQSMSLPLLPSGSDQEEKPESASLPPKIRLVRPVPPEEPNSDSDPIRPNRINAHPAPTQPSQPARTGPSAESPRLNAAGKVVFTGLELQRSSSSPGSFTGGPRVKYRGIERSYSANVSGVRIAPVLNVPVCSLRGSRKSVSVFGFERIFKGERRERGGSTPSVGARAGASACSTNNKGKSEGES
ncbi:serine/arginine repetitive matrix-like protein [Rhynchospora pubera]|uniref:Serine/arginine repetitive matrix-like protein n=1 Tax=Rhynchospora pubera TaxID=906938 RepID=A0AAV8FA51_9POAL|nr:serine/arginine repetitive matrix-like protein [Rhynchospora pubera]